MPITRSQYIRSGFHKKSRPKKSKKCQAKKMHIMLSGRNPVTASKVIRPAPFIKVVVDKVFIMTPKKPNSAQRKVIQGKAKKNQKIFIAYIPGGGEHGIQPHSEVLLKCCNRKDLPGVRYVVIRGKLNALAPIRKNGRSLFGVKKPTTD